MGCGFLRFYLPKNTAHLRSKLLDQYSKFNFKELARDVEQFSCNPSDSKKVLFFYDYIKDYEFEVGVSKDNN